MAQAARILAGFVFIATPSHAYTITNDRGGRVSHYVSKVQNLHISGERVVIDGPCESACTLVLNLPADQVCATSRGSFGFHGARDEKLGLPSPAGNEELLRIYPGKVRNYIVRHYETFLLGVIRVKARRFVQAC